MAVFCPNSMRPARRKIIRARNISSSKESHFRANIWCMMRKLLQLKWKLKWKICSVLKDSAHLENVSGVLQRPFLLLASVFGNNHKHRPVGASSSSPPPHTHRRVPWKHALMRTGQGLFRPAKQAAGATSSNPRRNLACKMPTLKKRRLNLRHSPTERTVAGNYCIAFWQTWKQEHSQHALAMVTA